MEVHELNQILEDCLKEDCKAQEKLYEYTYRELFNCARRYCKDVEEAQWVFNFGMLKVYNSLPDFSVGTNYNAWAATILIRTSINYLKKSVNQRPSSTFLRVEEMNDVKVSLNMVFDRLEVERIFELIHGLPEQERLVFSMHEIDGYSHPEIEKETGINAGTSRWLLSSARKKLQFKVITESNINSEVYE